MPGVNREIAKQLRARTSEPHKSGTEVTACQGNSMAFRMLSLRLIRAFVCACYQSNQGCAFARAGTVARGERTPGRRRAESFYGGAL